MDCPQKMGMQPPRVQPTNHRGQRKYRLTLHSDMSGIYSRSEIEALGAQIARLIADEGAIIDGHSGRPKG